MLHPNGGPRKAPADSIRTATRHYEYVGASGIAVRRSVVARPPRRFIDLGALFEHDSLTDFVDDLGHTTVRATAMVADTIAACLAPALAAPVPAVARKTGSPHR